MPTKRVAPEARRPLHVSEVTSRIKRALLERTGRAWTARRTTYLSESVPVLLRAMPRRLDRDGRMSTEDRRELARTLGLPLRGVPPEGLVFPPERYEELVTRAETGTEQGR